jgi:hypothetical protein
MSVIRQAIINKILTLGLLSFINIRSFWYMPSQFGFETDGKLNETNM